VTPVAFWALAIVLVGSALAVVLSKNLFHASCGWRLR
jgi:NADH:ubiquinone oxidoreductase subunit 6 (subunit J)